MFTSNLSSPNRSDFRSIPLKKPFEVDIVKPLKNVLSVITSTSKNSQDFTNQINEFSKLRTTALWKAYERRDGALEDIYTYFDQLNALEKKIPAGELQIPFKWQDAFCKGLFLTKSKLTIPSVGYEKLCVLFNIAALQSFVGSSQSVDDDEGLKQAAKLFQQSAGILDYLKSNVTKTLHREPTPDFYPDTLTALTCLMLGQAQEAFVHKSRREQMKNELIAKICNETSALYNDALKAIQHPHISHLWDKETVPTISGKQLMFRGMAQFYQGLECKTKKVVGEHIARLKISIEYLKSALKSSNKLSRANGIIAEAEQMLRDAIKDNDCIFHDKVPDSNSLASIGRVSLVKPQPLPQKFSNEFRDLFGELVPATVQNMLILFKTRKQETVQSEVFKLREATQLLNGILASLNLPAAIEDTEEQDIPQSLVTKSTTVRNHGGSSTISRMLDRLPDLQTRNTEILGDIERMLSDEEESDDKLRRKFKEKWTRKNSSRLTSSFRSNLEKYRRTINTAIHADASVKGKFEEHRIYIELLGNGPTAVARAVPQASLKKANQDTQSVSHLKQLMKQVDTIKIDRDAIEGELKSINEDMKDTFLSALNKGNLNEEALIEDGLRGIFSPIQRKVKESLTVQEHLIEDIQRTNIQFTAEKKEQNIAAEEREKFLKKLAVAYDAFKELSNNLEEGTKFYNDLTEVLLLFQSKVADFCFARRTEKEELLRDLEKEARAIAQGGKEARAIAQGGKEARAIAQGGSLKQNNDNSVPGAAAACSTGPELPYPSFPQNMPLPYGSHLQLPYPQYFMPPLPNVYYTMPLPTGHQPPPQNPEHSSNNQNSPTS